MASLTVSLPMYNLPEMRAANTAFWQAMRFELARLDLVETPEALAFDQVSVPPEIGKEMFFTQVCGWPRQTIYAGQTVMLGVPVYDAPYCEGPTHAGVFVVRADSGYVALTDLRGCDFVFNSVHSNSGMNLPRRSIAELAGGQPFFGSIRETHSHPDNIARVANGEADATCVDNVTYAFVMRHRPHLAEKTRILAPTPPTHAIPFVTSIATGSKNRAALEAALQRVAKAPEWQAVRDGLLLRDVHPADPADYLQQIAYEQEAIALGYPMLR